MIHRKVRALAVLLIAAIAISPIDSPSQTTKKKQSSSARKRTTKKKAARKPVRRAAPAPPPINATSPRSLAALAADMGAIAGRVRSGQFGVMAVSLTRGDTLFTHNAGAPLMPASTMKMLTSAAAFEQFGPRYQFSTDVLYDGTLGPDGTLTGNLYLRGDGDPAPGLEELPRVLE